MSHPLRLFSLVAFGIATSCIWRVDAFVSMLGVGTVVGNPATIDIVRRASSASTAVYAGAVDGSFDDAAFEADRLSKDALAMDDMRDVAADEYSKLRTPWKWRIRKAVWDYLEDNDIAQFPRPVHHRIPNFKGADKAADRLSTLPEFQSAQIVKVNPDTPQRGVRHLVLESGKTLLTPQPRLRTGFFSTLSKKDVLPDVPIQALTSSRGAAKHGTPVSLYEDYIVDIVIVGSTAICPTTGKRVGKGEGFAELEWGILSLQGNIDPDKVLVVTTVHDCQVYESNKEPWTTMAMSATKSDTDTNTDTEESKSPFGTLTKHDVPVDVIVTPTRIIHVSDRAPKPSGVYWELLSPQKLAVIKVLRQLKERLEEESAGLLLPSGPDEVLPPTASRGKQQGGRGGGGGRGRSNTTGRGGGQQTNRGRGQ